MSMVGMLLENGHRDRARAVLREMQEAVSGDEELLGFVLFLHLTELYVYTEAKDASETARVAAQMEATFKRYPLRRELGLYQIFSGFDAFQQGSYREAEQRFEQGIDTLKNTRFLPHLYSALRYLRVFLRRMPATERDTPEARRLVVATYGRLWEEYAAANDFALWEQRVDRELQHILGKN